MFVDERNVMGEHVVTVHEMRPHEHIGQVTGWPIVIIVAAKSGIAGVIRSVSSGTVL